MLTRRVFLAASAAGALTALPNRRGEAHPIALTEREARIDRARSLPATQSDRRDHPCGRASLDYFTGIRWGSSERFFASVFPQKSTAFYVAPSFEQERLRGRMSQAPAGRESKILTRNEDDDPYALVARALREAGIATGKAGIEGRVPFVFSHGLRQAARALELISATPVAVGCHSVKSQTGFRGDASCQVDAWSALPHGSLQPQVIAKAASF